MNEFFLNDLLDEAIEVMKELVDPNAMGVALKSLIRAVLEKKSSERTKFNVLIQGFYTKGILSQEQVIFLFYSILFILISPFSFFFFSALLVYLHF